MRKVFLIALVIIAIAVTGIWTVVLLKKEELWPVAIGSFVVFIGFELFLFRKLLQQTKKDLNEQMKLTGEVKILSKSAERDNYFIKLDDTEIKELSIDKKVYNKIETGDIIHIEVSKYQKHIFKLNRAGEDLLLK